MKEQRLKTPHRSPTRMHWSLVPGLAVVVIGVLFLTGCGADKDGSADAGSSSARQVDEDAIRAAYRDAYPTTDPGSDSLERMIEVTVENCEADSAAFGFFVAKLVDDGTPLGPLESAIEAGCPWRLPTFRAVKGGELGSEGGTGGDETGPTEPSTPDLSEQRDLCEAYRADLESAIEEYRRKTGIEPINAASLNDVSIYTDSGDPFVPDYSKYYVTNGSISPGEDC